MRLNGGIIGGGGVVAALILVALLAPLIAPHSPNATLADGLNHLGAPVGPGSKFLLGTDELGRDVFSRLVYALRVSLMVGLVASAVSVCVGTLLGILAGYWANTWVDVLIMRLTDVMLAFPFLLFVILLTSVLRPSLALLYAVIGLLGWPTTCRIARGETLGVMQEEYIEAARAIGAAPARIIARHVLPNILAPIITYGMLRVGHYVLLEGALSYLGAGVPPPTPSLGSMIHEGQQYFQVAPWIALYPGIALAVVVLGFNLLGDGLNDALNVHLSPHPQ